MRRRRSRAVGDITAVSFAAFFAGVFGQDNADGEPEEVVDGPHQVGVAFGQVVVDRGEMGSLADESVNIERERGGERLAFARFHFGNAAIEQGDAADHLHFIVALLDGANGGFAHEGVSLGHDAGQRLARFGPIAQREAAFLQVAVRFFLQLGLESEDLLNDLAPAGQPPRNGAAEDR
jgi:hypothetical protein